MKVKENKVWNNSRNIKLFEELKYYFQTVLMLVYFNPTRYLILEANAFSKALKVIFYNSLKK